MSRGPIGPGDDVEAWCTRCKMNLNHRVIAVVGSEVKRVHCLTCGGDHNYYPPKGAGRHAHAGAPRKTPVRKSSAGPGTQRGNKSEARAEGEWNRFMSEMPEGVSPRAYSPKDTFDTGEYIEHPTFGTGRVLDVVGREKIEAIFRSGRKVLICNRKSA